MLCGFVFCISPPKFSEFFTDLQFAEVFYILYNFCIGIVGKALNMKTEKKVTIKIASQDGEVGILFL